MTRRIDAHQHFWRLQRGDYGWLTPDLAPIHRDFEPDDLAPMLRRHGIAGTILVQAAPTVAETEFMLDLAVRHAFIEGVVGWVDFEAKDAPERIAELAARPKLKGLRPMIHDIADPRWMLRPDLAPAFEAMIAHGLVFDALVRPQHLPYLAELVGRYPELRVVIDHCAKPDIAAGGFPGWARDLAAVAAAGTVCCKLSGLVTEAGADPSAEALAPYVNHVISVFGPSRMIWGSDWPVVTLAASYEVWLAQAQDLVAQLPEAEIAAIFGGNAIRTYGLPE